MTTETKTVMTTHEVSARFNALAGQEKWFEIQDELFADNVRSIEPAHSPYLGYAEGKAAVRKKAEDFMSRVSEVHKLYTTEPLVTGNYFAVGREKDLTVQGHGRIQIYEIMLYEVKGGRLFQNNSFIKYIFLS